MKINRISIISEMARQRIGVEALAKKACVSRSTVTNLRSGKPCNLNTVRRVALALGIDVELLLEEPFHVDQ